jgi:hypothetical protein
LRTIATSALTAAAPSFDRRGAWPHACVRNAYLGSKQPEPGSNLAK